MNGGLKGNAIPREAEATVLIHEEDVQKITERLEQWENTFKNELQSSDPEVSIKFEKIETFSSNVFSKETVTKAITSLLVIPHGVQGMSMGIEGLVESSTNLGVVTSNEAEMVFESEIRSSVKSIKYNMVTQAKAIADMLGCELLVDADYQEWPYNPDSKLKKLFEETYKEKYHEDIEIIAVHAGIECGVFIDKIPGLDTVSIGPDMFSVHTPEEHLSIPSTINNWEYFVYTLKRMKDL